MLNLTWTSQNQKVKLFSAKKWQKISCQILKRLILSLVWFFLSGCGSSSTFLIKHQSETILLKSIPPEYGQIILKNGKIYAGFNIRITPDSTFWTDALTRVDSNLINFTKKKDEYRISNSEIRKIVFHLNKSLASAGYGAGALIGIGIGIALGRISNNDANFYFNGLLYSGFLGPLGGLVGMCIGSGMEREEFILDHQVVFNYKNNREVVK